MDRNTQRRRRLQVCMQNRLAQSPGTLLALKESGCVVEVVECLDQCTRCNDCVFALVSGKFWFAATPEDLIERLRMSGNTSPPSSVEDSQPPSRKR